MRQASPWLYLGVFSGATALSWWLTPLALRYARRRDIMDVPGSHKSHATAMPYLGGLAIAAAFAVAVMVAAAVHQPPSGLGELATVLAMALALAAIGLVDDLRGLGVLVRLGAQVAAGASVWFLGAGVQLFDVGALDLVVTVLWVVGITNAFNLLDNMDGLSGGVAAIAATTFAVIAMLNGQYLVAALGAALAGCAAGFLRHNFYPARIYMGDAGSLFLGFLLAYLGVKLRFEGPTYVTFFVPITVLGVAILDTMLVTVTRLQHNRNPFLGGRDHVSHRLVFVGVPVPYAVSLIYAAAIGHGWLAIAMSRVDVTTNFILMGLVLTADLFLGVILAQAPVYETSRRRRLMLQEVVEHETEVQV
jgi:UDP-GlcNAc:undecaprenyl-phosphate GlcNAc-1-phosphate transferase